MDVFERVREVNAGVSLTEDRISGARSRLLDGIDASRAAERKHLTRRPMFLIAGAVATVAAVTATVVVITQPAAPDPRVEAVPVATGDPRAPGETIPKPAPTAGATVSDPFPGTTPQAGQYLRVANATESLLYRDQYTATFTGRHYVDAPPVSAVILRDEGVVFAPADRSGDWLSQYGPVSQRTQFFPSDLLVESGLGWDDQLIWDVLRPPANEVHETRSTGGLASDAFPVIGSSEYYSTFPRDPQALLEYLRAEDRGYEQTPEQKSEAAVGSVVDLLRSNLAPADLRAALMDALELSGLAEKVPMANGIVGYRISYRSFDTRTDTLSVDAVTGWVTEYTARWNRAANGAGDMVPTTVPDIRMTYTVSIVDSLP